MDDPHPFGGTEPGLFLSPPLYPAYKQLFEALVFPRPRFQVDILRCTPNPKEEFNHLRYQSGTSSQWGGRRYPPYAFTEQGVAMLSSVLRSQRAIQVNIAIMRVFVSGTTSQALSDRGLYSEKRESYISKSMSMSVSALSPSLDQALEFLDFLQDEGPTSPLDKALLLECTQERRDRLWGDAHHLCQV